jgi:hypothetical protein
MRAASDHQADDAGQDTDVHSVSPGWVRGGAKSRLVRHNATTV